MDAYKLEPRLTLIVKDELGGEVGDEFSEAEIQVKTWVPAPYGYGSADWRAETLKVWIHNTTGTLTVDPEAFVGRPIERREYR